MALRTIKQIVKASKHRMGDSIYYQPLPGPELEMLDPFLLLHHWGPNTYSKGIQPMNFDAHPHKGFVPVTFVFQGEVFHRDSLGNNSLITSGGIQWMHSGKGIVHSEGPTREFQEQGGTVELIQLWINLPAKLKESDPEYQGFQKIDIPTIQYDNGQVLVNIVSGDWEEVEGPVDSVTRIQSATITMHAGSSFSTEADVNRTPLLYVLDGTVQINGKYTGTHDLVVFEPQGSEITFKAESDTNLLFVTGEPINEPVVQQGPFVMNTKKEIYYAMQEFQSGKMGALN